MAEDATDPKDTDAKGGGTATRAKHPGKKVDSRIRALIERHGSTTRALDVQMREILDLEAQVETLADRVPKETDAVIPKAELDAYRALGTPDQLGKKLKDGETAAGEMARVKRAEAYGEKATAAGLAPKALVKLAEKEGFVPDEVREEERDGKKVKVLYVRPADDEKAKAVPLEQFATDRDFAEFLPALTATGGTTQNGQQGGQQGSQDRTAGRAAGGAQYPHQSAGGSGAGANDPVGAFLERREQARQARPSPLAPPGAPAVKAS